MPLLRTLARLLGPPDIRAELDEARVSAIETHVTALYDELRQQRAELRALHGTMVQLQTDEARRAAEHATMVDALQRLYKRVSARIAREEMKHHDETPESESTLALRKRLGR